MRADPLRQDDICTCIAERAATSWCAVALRLTRGGVRYSHGTLRVAANPERVLRRRLTMEDVA